MPGWLKGTFRWIGDNIKIGARDAYQGWINEQYRRQQMPWQFPDLPIQFGAGAPSGGANSLMLIAAAFVVVLLLLRSAD